MGYILEPAQILITHTAPPGNIILNPNVNIKEVQFICPDIDIAPLFLELQELKTTLKKILDSKSLAQEIGNELVGETYLRWDTQVRFYPTIVFIFLEDEEHFIKRNVLASNQYKKKVKIKLRITNHSIEKLEKDNNFLKTYTLELRSKIFNLIDTYNFNTGNLRCTYVNQGSVSWKTTVFPKDKQQACYILNQLSNLIGENMNPNFFTFSNVRLKNDKEDDIPVYLHKVSLLINKKNLLFLSIIFNILFNKYIL